MQENMKLVNMKLEREFQVDDMQCEGCGGTIEKALLAVAGVLAVKVDAETGKVWVQYDPTRVRFDALPPIVAEAGFPRLFRLSEEHHRDYLWRQQEEEMIHARHDGE